MPSFRLHLARQLVDRQVFLPFSPRLRLWRQAGLGREAGMGREAGLGREAAHWRNTLGLTRAGERPSMGRTHPAKPGVL